MTASSRRSLAKISQRCTRCSHWFKGHFKASSVLRERLWTHDGLQHVMQSTRVGSVVSLHQWSPGLKTVAALHLQQEQKRSSQQHRQGVEHLPRVLSGNFVERAHRDLPVNVCFHSIDVVRHALADCVEVGSGLQLSVGPFCLSARESLRSAQQTRIDFHLALRWPYTATFLPGSLSRPPVRPILNTICQKRSDSLQSPQALLAGCYHVVNTKLSSNESRR